jgi:hypothetical protein
MAEDKAVLQVAEEPKPLLSFIFYYFLSEVIRTFGLTEMAEFLPLY